MISATICGHLRIAETQKNVRTERAECFSIQTMLSVSLFIFLSCWRFFSTVGKFSLFSPKRAEPEYLSKVKPKTMGRNLTCNLDNLQVLSELCTHYDVPEDIECFNPQISEPFTNFAAIWCIFHSVIGFCGNLITLLAIPYATYRKR